MTGQAEQTPAPGESPPAPWYAGKADDETMGVLQTRGWHDKPADVVALEAIKSYREAEKFLGAPKDELLRVPRKDAPESDIRAFWSRLGAPAEAKDYDFSIVKDSQGNPIPAERAEKLREIAAKHHLPKDTAASVAADLLRADETAAAAARADHDAKVQEERAKLDKNWGANREANLVVARNAAAVLGVSPEAVAALEDRVGYADVMEMFRKIGTKIGEDRFVRPENPGGDGVMTREQAVATKAELMRDTAWVKRYMDGGSEEARRMMALNALIVGDDTDRSRSA